MAKNNSHNNKNNNNQIHEPKPGRWYNITLGSSFTDPDPSSKFCSLRYEFKPASVDRSQAGTLHKGKDSHVTVEYPNLQPGRPKVSFEGVSEDYKENDAVLIFDGEGFRLERLHRAVKRLRHVRLPGESASGKVSSSLPVPVQVEQIDVRGTESLGAVSKDEKSTGSPLVPRNPPSASPDFKRYDSDENVDILGDDEEDQIDEMGNVDIGSQQGLDIDINKPHQADDEIADVDISDDEADRGPSAAEALKAQVNALVKSEKSSSSGSSSQSGSSSDSESSDTNSDISI